MILPGGLWRSDGNGILPLVGEGSGGVRQRDDSSRG